MEIPFIMATLLWHFDISIEEESKGWKDGLRVYGFFAKPKLMVKVKDVGGALDSRVSADSEFSYAARTF